MEKIIATYKERDGHEHRIIEADNGGIFIELDIHAAHHGSTAGAYKDLQEAREYLKKFRPAAVEVRNLYFKLADYNRARIIIALRELIRKSGGILIFSKYEKPYRLHAVTAERSSKETREQIEALPAVDWFGHDWAGGTMQYVKNGYYYSVSFDNNPFFPTIYGKIKIDGQGNYSGERSYFSSANLTSKDNGELLLAFDAQWGICSEDTIQRLAASIYRDIINRVEGGEECPTWSQRKRVRVPNTYNRGYHYEYITRAERRNVLEDAYIAEVVR